MRVQLIFTPQAYLDWIRDHAFDPEAPSAAPALAHPLAHYIATEIWEQFSVALQGLELRASGEHPPVSPTATLAVRNGIFETYRRGSQQEPEVSYGGAYMRCMLPSWTQGALDAQPPLHADRIDAVQTLPWSIVDREATLHGTPASASARPTSRTSPTPSTSIATASPGSLSGSLSEEDTYEQNLRTALETLPQLSYGSEQLSPEQLRGGDAAATTATRAPRARYDARRARTPPQTSQTQPERVAVPEGPVRPRKRHHQLRLALEFMEEEVTTWLTRRGRSPLMNPTNGNANVAMALSDAQAMLQEFVLNSSEPLIESLTDARVYMKRGRAKVDLCVFEIGLVRYSVHDEYRSRTYGCCMLTADLPAWTTPLLL